MRQPSLTNEWQTFYQAAAGAGQTRVLTRSIVHIVQASAGASFPYYRNFSLGPVPVYFCSGAHGGD